MKIDKVKINNFGKLNNKEMDFNNSINIIYGKNEAGKSTLLKFISGIFYGLSKNKNGKEITDFEKYTPWNIGEFSGKINYELNNKKQYEIFRDFNKKNPKIYNENSEDISKEFNIDKNKGNEFFKEQTGVEEELFYSSCFIEQEETKLDNSKQKILIQKIANLISSGNDNISFKKSIEKLNKKLLEEVGTERSTEKPINIIENNIKKLNEEKNSLEEMKYKKYEIDELNKKLNAEIENKKIKINVIKKIKRNKEEENIEKEIIKINKNSIEQIEEKINKINKEKINNKKEINKNNKIHIIIIIILSIISALLFIINSIKIINYLFIFIPIIYLIIILNKYLKNNKIKKEIIKIKNNSEKEINLLEENKLIKNKEIKELENKLNEKINNNKNNIYLEFNLLNNLEIENLLNKEKEEIENILEKEENEFKNINLKLHELEIDRNNIIPKLNNEAKIEEELNNLINQKEELNSLARSINIAKDTLEEAYSLMKDNITPKFTENLSKIVQKISNGKYKNVQFNDEKGLTVELENGEYISANLLSVGTIDQMYLALRLSVVQEITEEKLPIVLDESFAYYDDSRLENILKFLYEDYSDYQVFILTCSNRERVILNRLNIDYNFIEL